MPEDTKVFDVSKPSKVGPTPTSKPVIVGHHPIMSDPMVREGAASEEPNASEDSSAKPIHVSMDDEAPHDVLRKPEESQEEAPADILPTHEEKHEEHKAEPSPAFSISEPGEKDEFKDEVSNTEETPGGVPPTPEDFSSSLSEPEEEHPKHEEEPKKEEDGVSGSSFTPLSSIIEDEDAQPTHEVGSTIPPTGGHAQDVEPLSIPRGAGPKRSWPKVFGWLFGILFVLLAGAFVAVDAGLVQSDIKLPFHIFNNQKTSSSGSTASTTPPPPTPAPTPPSTPAGFASYEVGGTPASFAYPTAWGEPTVSKDPGFSERGGGNESDGVHAYIVSFTKNKDVEVALTSNQYLSAKRDALYYDFLKWCNGTNDDNYYYEVLKFTTDNGVDSPGTVACDQGPLSDVTKINDATIMQAKAKDTKGKQIGDVYTMSTAHPEFSVLRVKDASMKNGDQIKQLLDTAKVKQ